MNALRHLMLCVATASVGLAFDGSVHAALANDVTVRLAAPGGVSGDATPIDATEIAPLASGILAANLGGSGGPVGSWMLDNEKIVFAGNSLLLRVAAGYDDGLGNFSTGYLGLGGVHARYVLSDLNISGYAIVSFSGYAYDGFATAGFSGLASPTDPNSYIHLVDAHSISFALDDLFFKDRGQGGSNNYAEFRIDLISQPVPEPSSLAFMLVGGLAILGASRTRPLRTGN